MGKLIDMPGAEAPVEGAIPRFVVLPSSVDEARVRLAALMREKENWTQDAYGYGPYPNEVAGRYAFGELGMQQYGAGAAADTIAGAFDPVTGTHGARIPLYPTEACLMGGVAIVTDGLLEMGRTLTERLGEAIAYWLLETPKGLQHLSECDTEHDDVPDPQGLVQSFNDCTWTDHPEVVAVLDLLLAGTGLEFGEYKNRIFTIATEQRFGAGPLDEGLVQMKAEHDYEHAPDEDELALRNLR